MRRFWIGLGIVAVALVAAILGLNLWVNSYLRSEAFRRLVTAKAGEALRADADCQPLDWSGSSVFSGALTARGEPGAPLETLDAEQVRANVDWRAIFDGAWRIDHMDIVRLDVKVRTDRRRAATATEPGPGPDAPPPPRSFIPHRFVLDRISVQDANADLGAFGRLRNVPLTVQPEGNGWIFDGRGGKVELPARPSLAIDSFRVRLQQNVVYLTDAALRLGAGGTVAASGEVGGSRGPYDLHFEWRNVAAADVLDATWRSRVGGTVSGSADRLGRAGRSPLTTGKFFLADGTLEGLPVQKQIANFTRSPQFERMPLREVSGDFTIDDATTTVRNFVLESPGLLRIEGGCRIGADGALRGSFRVGVTSQSLQWLPGSQEKVFVTGGAGYLWTDIEVGGTLEQPTENLSGRLARALGERAVDTGVDLIEKAPDHAADAVDKALDILLPLIR